MFSLPGHKGTNDLHRTNPEEETLRAETNRADFIFLFLITHIFFTNFIIGIVSVVFNYMWL